MKLRYKAFILVLLYSGLIGCDEDGIIPDLNVGSCVVVPRPVVGKIEKYKVMTYYFPTADSYTLDVTVTSISNTSISTTKKIILNNFIIDREETKDYTISNNFIDYTQRTIHEVITSMRNQGLPPTVEITDTTNFYDPFRRRETGKVCENQTWTTTYDSTTNTTRTGKNDSSFVESISEIYTIEAINKLKTVQGGTFNTYLLKHEFKNYIEKSWIDIRTGKTVSFEERDTSGKLNYTEELIE